MILVLEDDDTTRQVMGMLLDSMHLEHMEARNVPEAIAIMSKHCPVIFITDYLMTMGDAHEAVKYCHNHHKHCKTILVTAMNKTQAEAAAKDMAVTHMLLKPFDIEAFSKLLI